MGTKGTCLPSKSLPDPLSENQTKKGEDARVHAHKEGNPPLLESLDSFLGEESGGNQEPLKEGLHERPVEAPPERLKDLYTLWEHRARKLARMSPWSPLKEIAALENMASSYLISELNEILTHLERTHSKVGMEFIRPSDFQRSYFGTPLIDAAYAELKTFNKPRLLKQDGKRMSLEEFRRRTQPRGA
jgi:hypothetical protein